MTDHDRPREEETTEPQDPVDRLLLACLAASESQWDARVDEACRDHPELADALRARLSALRRVGQIVPPSEEEVGDGPRLKRFRLLRRLGSGGMGVVWLAEQADLGRRVALKLVRPDYLDSESAKARFAREALAATKLDHPAICPVYEVGEEDGIAFIAMRYLEGETLADWIARRHAERDGSSNTARREEVEELLGHFERLASGLQAAHDRQLVHRDIKPGNVFLTEQGEAVLLDFGLARDLESEAHTLTATGDQLGTPAYMAPEQVRGDSGKVDHRADVYALGVTLFEALTGRRPFEHRDREQLYQQILRDPPPDPTRLRPGLPAEIRHVLDKALEKEPEDRFATVAELGEQLRRIRRHEPITVRRLGVLLRARRWTQRNPVAATALLLLGAGLVGALVFVQLLLAQRSELRRQTTRAEAIALANEAIVDVRVDPSAALRTALAAFALEPSYLSRTALHAATASQHEDVVIDAPEVIDVRWSPNDPNVIASYHLFEAPSVWRLDREPPERVELAGHGDRVDDLVFSPDGALVATSCRDGVVRVFRVTDGALHWDSGQLGPGVAAYDVAFAPRGGEGGDSIAAAIVDRSTRSLGFRVWDMRGAERVAPEDVESGFGRFPPSCVFVDEDTLACSTSKAVNLWHLDDDSVVRLETPRPGPFGVTWLRDVRAGGSGTTLAFGMDGYASVHGPDGSLVLRVDGHDEEVREGAVSPDGRHVVTGGQDRRALLTDVASGKSVALPGHVARLNHVAFSSDGRLVSTATTRGVIRVFDLDGHLVVRLPGHGSTARSVRFSPDSHRLASAGLDDTIRIWSVEPRGLPVLRGHEHEVSDVAFSDDGRYAATASLDGTLRVWSTSGEPDGSPFDLHEAVNGIAFQPGRDDRVAVAAQRTVHVVDLSTAEVERVVTTAERQPDHLFRSVAWSGDGGRLFTFERRNSGEQAAIRAWQRQEDGAWAEAWTGPELPQCHAFALSPRDDEVLVGCYDGHARAYGLDEGRERAAFAHGAELSGVGYSPDGSVVYTLSRVASDVVKLWDRHGGGDPVVLAGHRQQPIDAAFEPDGTRIATCSPDGTVRLWRTADGTELLRIEAHDAIVRAVAWSPDGRYLASAGSDGVARLWYAHVPDLVDAARALVRDR